MSHKDLTFYEHLDELRFRILKSVLAVVVLTVFSWFFSDKILQVLTRPAGQLVFLQPAEAFLVRFKVALGSGLILALPVILFQAWRYLNPALLRMERRALALTVFFSCLLFLCGAASAFFVVLPAGVRFLLGMGTDTIRPMISLDSYFSFASAFMIAFGLVFQLPLAVVVLAKLGIVTPEFLKAKRKYVIMGVFILAAILTPGPDILSQFLMAVPTLILFEISILLAGLVVRKKELKEGDTKSAGSGDEFL